jgi:hypothetical protein
MTKENILASSLAATTVMLVEALTEKEQYQEWWSRKTIEYDKLRAENTKLRSDLEFANAELKNAKAALSVKEKTVAELAKDESPFTEISPED